MSLQTKQLTSLTQRMLQCGRFPEEAAEKVDFVNAQLKAGDGCNLPQADSPQNG